MEKELIFESITIQTEQEIDDFITAHPNKTISYWDWRECLTLIIKVYDELAESTKKFSEKIDEILKPYDVNNLSYFDVNKINAELSKLGVVSNQRIHDKIKKLNEYHY